MRPPKAPKSTQQQEHNPTSKKTLAEHPGIELECSWGVFDAILGSKHHQISMALRVCHAKSCFYEKLIFLMKRFHEKKNKHIIFNET